MNIKIGLIRKLYKETGHSYLVDLLDGYMMENDEFEIAITHKIKTQISSQTPKEFWTKNSLPRLLPIQYCDIPLISGYYISGLSEIHEVNEVRNRGIENKNVFPTRAQAECVLELSELLQIHASWIDGWDIEKSCGGWTLSGDFYEPCSINPPFMFPTLEMSRMFYTNFSEKLERIKQTIGWS